MRLSTMDIKEEIKSVAIAYRKKLNLKLQTRIAEMKKDDNSHHLIYKSAGCLCK